jgi:hypothetical protein
LDNDENRVFKLILRAKDRPQPRGYLLGLAHVKIGSAFRLGSVDSIKAVEGSWITFKNFSHDFVGQPFIVVQQINAIEFG